MPKPWRLTRLAEASLTDIAIWTVQTFGPRKAAEYENQLIAACRSIAAGTAQSQECRRLFDPDIPPDLRLARVGRHFVIYMETHEQITIIDFLHGRSNIAGRLATHFPDPDEPQA